VKTVSAARITEVANCIRALHEHRREQLFAATPAYLAGYAEAIRALGERRREMRSQLAAHAAKCAGKPSDSEVTCRDAKEPRQ